MVELDPPTSKSSARLPPGIGAGLDILGQREKLQSAAVHVDHFTQACAVIVLIKFVDVDLVRTSIQHSEFDV